VVVVEVQLLGTNPPNSANCNELSLLWWNLNIGTPHSYRAQKICPIIILKLTQQKFSHLEHIRSQETVGAMMAWPLHPVEMVNTIA
jgi:hypothetical protein